LKRDRQWLIPFFLFMINYERRLNIKSLAEADRPREKLKFRGRRHLTDAELIAVTIGSGSKNETSVELSQRILNAYENDLSLLGNASIPDLAKFYGMGEAKALSIIAALELGRRKAELTTKHRQKVRGSKEAFNVLQPALADLSQEEFWILMLDAANGAINKVMISRGGRAGTMADPKVIFKKALDYDAAYIILAHNHPSGNLKPSEDDIRLTRKLAAAGQTMDLPVVDHLIITSTTYLSMADEGLM